jgi:hypothetical protein
MQVMLAELPGNSVLDIYVLIKRPQPHGGAADATWCVVAIRMPKVWHPSAKTRR